MPKFTATDPQSGESVDFEWYEDRPPTEADMEEIFASRGAAKPSYGGSGASMRAAGPEDQQSLWSKASEAVSRALFGDEDRAAAKAAGIGLQPTPAELLAGVGAIAAPVAGAALAAPAAAAIAPHMPRIGGAISGGTQGYKRAGIPGALVGAVTGAAVPSIAAAGGAVEGYQQAGVPGAVAGYVMSGGKGTGKLVEAGKAAARVMGGAKAAEKTVQVAKVARKLRLKTGGPGIPRTAAEEAALVKKAAEAIPGPTGLPPSGEYARLKLGEIAAEFKAPVSKAAGAADDLEELLRQSIRAKGGIPVDTVKETAKAAAKTVITPIKSAEDLTSKIMELRKTNGLSGAQIAAALKQWHGIPMKEANQAVKMVFEAKGL